MKKKILEEIKDEIIRCKTEQDHVWKQTSDWERQSHIEYADSYGHPEDRMGWTVTYETATFECQNCGMTKVLKR